MGRHKKIESHQQRKELYHNYCHGTMYYIHVHGPLSDKEYMYFREINIFNSEGNWFSKAGKMLQTELL